MQDDSDETAMPSGNKSLPLIYIVGNSHCGSTLLGFLLSANPDIIFLGELKTRTWLKERFCSCGLEVAKCPYYSTFFEAFNAAKQKLFEKIRPRKRLGLFEINTHMDIGTKNAMDDFYKMVRHRALELYPNATHITDSSKSVWMLHAWLQAETGKDIRIIWLRRSLPANVASFIKRGNKFWTSYLSIKVNDWLIRRFLKNVQQPHLEVEFGKLQEDYASVMNGISDYIGTSIPLIYQNHHNHHVISGNRFTRTEFMDGYTGLNKDDQWESILTAGQKKILTWIK